MCTETELVLDVKEETVPHPFDLAPWNSESKAHLIRQPELLCDRVCGHERDLWRNWTILGCQWIELLGVNEHTKELTCMGRHPYHYCRRDLCSLRTHQHDLVEEYHEVLYDKLYDTLLSLQRDLTELITEYLKLYHQQSFCRKGAKCPLLLDDKEEPNGELAVDFNDDSDPMYR